MAGANVSKWLKLIIHKNAILTAQTQQPKNQRAQHATTSTDETDATVQDANPVAMSLMCYTTSPIVLKSPFLIAIEKMPLKDSPWMLVSSASDHMTNDIGNFSHYSEIHPIQLQTAAKGSTLEAIGVGTVDVTLFDGGQAHDVLIQDVLYVPKLSQNIMSLSKLVENGACCRTSAGKICLYSGSTVIAEAVSSAGLYAMRLSVKKAAGKSASVRNGADEPIHI